MEQSKENFPKGFMHFPRSVWETSEKGWFLRKAQAEDHKRRKEYANERGYYYKPHY